MRILLYIAAFYSLNLTFAYGQASSFTPPSQEQFVVHDCNDMTTVCWDLPLENLIEYEVTVEGAPYSGTLQGCNFDTLITYFYNTVFGQGNQGPYRLNQWSINGEAFSGDFDDMSELVDLMNNWDESATWTIDPQTLSIEGGTPQNDYGTLQIEALTTSSSTQLAANNTYKPMGTQVRLAPGVYPFEFTHTNGTVVNTLVTITCAPIPDSMDYSVYVGDDQEVCLDGSALTGPIATVENVCGSTPLIDWRMSRTHCVEISALQAGTTPLCLAFCDANGFCDTSFISFRANPLPTTEYLYDTIPGNQLPYAYCPDLSQLIGELDTVYNACADDSGDFVAFNFNETTNCLKYQSLDCNGTETACIVVCANGMCDTTIYSVTVTPENCAIAANTFLDTLAVGEMNSFCLDTTALPGNIVSIENICTDSSGVFADFDIDPNTYCVTWFGLSPGTDKACIELTDEYGNTALTTFCITVFDLQNDLILDTLELGNSENYCLETNELPGTVTSIENICPELGGMAVQFTINTVDLCVQTNTLAVGSDTACIVICDDLGYCDTTLLGITVIPMGTANDTLLAVNDTLSTPPNTEVVHAVLSNDWFNRDETLTFELLAMASGPFHGIARENDDMTIRYIPSNGFCGTDSFEYRICQNAVCDTATVFVTVDCSEPAPEPEDIVVCNGFSPNFDGINETFVIKGIENFPDHQLYVYNRWGNEVLVSDDYRNDWNGVWNGKDLPDGTYFYQLQLDDNRVFFGSLQIQR